MAVSACSERALIPLRIAVADVQDEELVGQDLRRFERALHLVHAVDAAGFLVVHDVDGGHAAAAHLRVGIDRRMQRVRLDLARLEPVGDLLDVLAAGVVEVLARGEDFNGLRAAAGERVEQAGVQTLAEEDMGGEGSKHGWGFRSLSSHCGRKRAAAPAWRHGRSVPGGFADSAGGGPGRLPVSRSSGSTAMHSPSLQWPPCLRV